MRKVFFLTITACLFFLYSAKAATITIPLGTTATMSGWTGDNYIVYGTLQSSSSIQIAGTLVVKSGGKIIVASTLYASGAFTFESGSEITATTLGADATVTVNGKVTISGNTTMNHSNLLTINSTGELSSSNITLNGGTVVNGKMTASTQITNNSGPITMACPGKITTQNLTNWGSILGSGTVTVSGSTQGNSPNVSSCPPLSVIFGGISAIISGNNLHLTWNTLTESNNDHFEIEVSDDGNLFTKIGEVKSTAVNGNTAIEQNYIFDYSFAGNTLATGFAIALLAGGVILFKEKKKRIIISVATFIVATIALYSCSKADSNLNTVNNKKTFVRIVQVDIDKKISTSQVIIATVK